MVAHRWQGQRLRPRGYYSHDSGAVLSLLLFLLSTYDLGINMKEPPGKKCSLTHVRMEEIE